jgi:hypothetical protein
MDSPLGFEAGISSSSKSSKSSSGFYSREAFSTSEDSCLLVWVGSCLASTGSGFSRKRVIGSFSPGSTNFFFKYFSYTNFLIWSSVALELGFLPLKSIYLLSPILPSQYRLHASLPTVMYSNQSDIQVSSFVDLTRVTLGPSARWAPEQFRQTKTPKSMDAPTWM